LKKPLFIAVMALSAALLAQTPQVAPLRLETSIPMPGIKGDFDHFGADVEGNRLFLAAEEHKTVEVFDLKTGKHLHSVLGFDAPHQIVYVPQNNTILVTDSGPEGGNAGYVRVISGESYKIINSIKTLAAADSAGYNPATHLMYADTGGTEAKMDYTVVSVIDTPSAKVTNEIKVDSGRVEAIRFEHDGTRMFANLRTKGQVGVYDQKQNKLLANWDIKGAKENVSMALDEANHRLFVVCRKPAALVVFDTESGKQVASLPTVDRADDMAYDSKRKQIYISGGNGFIAVYSQKDPDHYEEIAKVPSGPAAKISIFIPQLDRLYVAASALGTNSAKLLIYKPQ
jgi:DNA-binding beta-propeller fold protein YncE